MRAPTGTPTIRTFTDDAGTAWEAWPTYPSVSGAHPRYEGPRRGDSANGASTAPLLAEGSLCFRSADGLLLRRLTPIPPRWEAAPDAELVLHCRAALPLPPVEA